jgi:hypothetical protein
MEHYRVFPNLGIHFKPTLPVTGKIWKKISLMLPIMATTKKKFVVMQQKLDFSDGREKKAKLHKFLSLARARSQTSGSYCSCAFAPPPHVALHV